MITLPRPTREVVPKPTREVVPRQSEAEMATVPGDAVADRLGTKAMQS